MILYTERYMGSNEVKISTFSRLIKMAESCITEKYVIGGEFEVRIHFVRELL